MFLPNDCVLADVGKFYHHLVLQEGDAKSTPPSGRSDHQPQRRRQRHPPSPKTAHTNLMTQTLLPMTSQQTPPAAPHTIPRQQTWRPQQLRPQTPHRAGSKAQLPTRHTTTQHSNLHRGKARTPATTATRTPIPHGKTSTCKTGTTRKRATLQLHTTTSPRKFPCRMPVSRRSHNFPMAAGSSS